MPQLLDRLLAALHWIHVAVLLIGACGYTWLWARAGFRTPWFVHGIAAVALLAGVLISCSLPPSTNPSPVVQFIAPLVFPVIAVSAAYLIPIGLGYLHLLNRAAHEPHDELNSYRNDSVR